MANVSGGLAGAAGGAATGAKIGSIIPGVGTAVGAGVGALLGGVSGLFSSKPKAPEYKPLDISKIISESRATAAENYRNSFALEKDVNPQQAALRTVTNSSLGSLASGALPNQQVANSLLSQAGTSKVDTTGLGDTWTNPLLEESANRIMHNLKLGGTLGKEAQASAVKAALEKGGAAGISGSGAGRGLVARDLGLTSIGLENDRIAKAQDAGKTMAALGLQGDVLRLQGQQLGLSDYLGRTNAALTGAGQDMQRIGLLASIVDGRPLPESGLSAGSVASLYVADNNARNQFAADSAAIKSKQYGQDINSLLGLAGTVAGSGALDSGGKGILDSIFKKKADPLGNI